MQSFIGVVDKKLLQTIIFKNLKTVNIQKSQTVQLFIARVVGNRINLIDNPLKESFVEYFRKRTD
jgi:hypothetical protein